MRTKALGFVAVLASCMPATVLGFASFTQLGLVQPALLLGESSELPLLSMYNPHGVFIALEDFGYFLMSVALLLAAAMFDGGTGLDRVIRWRLALGGLTGVSALPLTV